MKVLTAAEMQAVDRQTAELGIGDAILMENAGCRVVEYLVERFKSLSDHHVVILCGKGNNGGDGFVIARQLLTRFRLKRLDVVAAFPDDPSPARSMFEAAGGTVVPEITPEMHHGTLVIDAVLGSGIKGPARDKPLEWIRAINGGFPRAFVLAVDVPSGMLSDRGTSEGEVARAHATVTFTAPKRCHALGPNCDMLGHLVVAPIGSPESLLDAVPLHLSQPSDFRNLLEPRRRETNKGSFGHALIVGGAPGKSGAARMAGLGALRAGAGLVTVACSAVEMDPPELMTSPLPSSWSDLRLAADRKNVIAIGPGLGTAPEHVKLLRDTIDNAEQHLVIDADGLNALAGHKWTAQGRTRILTPHPGEMSRLSGVTTATIQQERLRHAEQYAARHQCILVLKGHRTLIAFPDGTAWINPTGTPALATGGTGDILTGMMAGLVAQFPGEVRAAVIAAVYLHGFSAQVAERRWGDKCLIATDLLASLPEAIRDCQSVPDRL